MRTSNLLPEECKAEIREEIQRLTDLWNKGERYVNHAVEIHKLKWVLNDKEG